MMNIRKIFMMEFVEEKIKKYWESILAVFLWFCVWGTYNTDIFRIFTPGFPQSIFALLHGIRSLFPFFALAITVFILVKSKGFNRKLFAGPMGALLSFSLIGIFSSFLSISPLLALYWGTLYITAILVIFIIAKSPKALESILIFNWIIALILTIILITSFFVHPGSFSMSTITNFLLGKRPFEGMNGVVAEANFFGMAGTRPTGLGRYAGLVAIIAFAFLWFKTRKIKILATLFFIFSFVILIFSRARTSVLAFFPTIFLISLFQFQKKKLFVATTIFILIILIPLNFYQFFFDYLTGENLLQENNLIVAHVNENNVNENNVNENNSDLPAVVTVGDSPYKKTEINVGNMLTLSGRTTGIWKDSWELFLSSPLWGKGFNADRIYLNGQHAHNSIMQALVQTGIIGILFFVFAFVQAWFLVLRNLKNNRSAIFFGVVGTLTYLTLRGITESSAYFGADFLFLVPIFAYLHFFPKKHNTANQMVFYQNKIDLLNISEVLAKINYWIKNESQKRHWIIVTGMHGTVEASRHADFKYILSQADMWVPDGISLVKLAQIKGYNIKNRVSGADLMAEFFSIANKEGFSSYFYGDTEDTLQALNDKLLKDFPNLKIVGSYSPPFRKLTEEEDAEIVQKINQAKPDVLWVALGLPKQEKWIFEHRDKINVPVVIGVGAAFKLLSGNVRRAPRWIGNLGFEWLWRLFQEPKRMWRRVFLDGPLFLWLVAKDLFF